MLEGACARATERRKKTRMRRKREGEESNVGSLRMKKKKKKTHSTNLQRGGERGRFFWPRKAGRSMPARTQRGRKRKGGVYPARDLLHWEGEDFALL